MSLTRRALLGAGAAIAAGTPLGACGSSHKPATKKPTAPQKVTFQAGLALLGREAAPYVARDKGWFAAAGLDVTVVAGQGTGGNLTTLSAGRADFTTLDFTDALRFREHGFANWTVVAALHQTFTGCIMAVKPGITRPSDLQGHTLAVISQGTNQVLFPLYAKLARFDPSKVQQIPVGATELLSVLASGAADAVTQQTLGLPTAQAVTHKPVVVMEYSRYLEDLLGNVVGVQTTMAQQQPDLVRRFTGALLQGLQYAIDNPDDAARIMKKSIPDLKVEAAAGELRALRPVATVGGGPLGGMAEERVMKAISLTNSGGLISVAPPPSAVVDFGLVPGGRQA
jgi:NitT/TauT family transport system substrate-binding protein